MDTSTHRGPMDYAKWIAEAARKIQNYYTANQGQATADGDICEIIETSSDSICGISDDLLLDNFHWSRTSDKDYDLFRAELVRRLSGNSTV